jgi:two-component system response regulator AdeR
MALVLVVEDDLDIAETLELYLRNDRHRTERARDGHTALRLFRSAQPDLVLLDIGLPGVDGIEVLKAIRAESNVPVIMLTARAEDVDELLGLELGADDYVTKPYSPRKLMARIKAVLRRSHAEAGDAPLRVGALEVDTYRVRARVHDRDLQLTPTEFKLLAHLASAPGRATSRDELLEAAMPDSDALERAVDVHLKNVRRKLAAAGGEGLLETVRGVGYRLREA